MAEIVAAYASGVLTAWTSVLVGFTLAFKAFQKFTKFPLPGNVPAPAGELPEPPDYSRYTVDDYD